MNALHLSDVAAAGGIAVLCDGAFSNLGFLSDPQPDMLTFVESARFVNLAQRCRPACIVTIPELAPCLRNAAAIAVAESPRWAFHRIHRFLAEETGFYGAPHETVVHPSARIHPRAFVAERNVRIGAGASVGPNAAVLERCVLEEDVTVDAGAVLGSSGFQTTRGIGGVEDMPHAGSLVIQRGAHIFPNASVATAVFRQSTVIGEDARIGNCAFVSHNVSIGREAVIGHGAVVNGNVRIGNGAWVGPGACIANSLCIGAGARVLLGAVVIGDVAAGEEVAGNYAIPHRALLRHLARLR